MENISLEVIANIVGVASAVIALCCRLVLKPSKLQRRLALGTIVLGVCVLLSPLWFDQIRPSPGLDWWFLGAMLSIGWGALAYLKRERTSNQTKEA